MDAATKKWNGAQKESARVFAVRSDKKTPAKTYLCLPGSGCKCVREALKQGTIDADTFVIAVERDPETADLIETQLNSLVKDYHLHRDVVNTLDLKEVLQDRRIDFAFLDLCGSLDMKLAHWMYGLKDVFTTNAVVAYTYSILGRNNKFITSAAGNLDGTIFHCGHFTAVKQVKRTIRAIKKRINKQLRRTARFIYDSDNKYRIATITAAWSLMNYRHSAQIICCEEYCDTTPMVMIKFQLSERDETKESHGNSNSWQAFWFLNAVSSELRKVESKKKKKAKVKIQKEKKARVNELAPWQQLGCPVDMPRADKAWVVIKAKQGIRPDGMKPAVWAWHPLNPNGIRRKKSA